MLIRPESAADLAAIDAVHRAAFPIPAPGEEPVEAGLVRALRSDPGWVPALSLVADDEAGNVVGHVVCTLGSIDDTPALGLGPLGVLPDRQGSGVGTALMHAVLAAADALGYAVVVLLGHPDYYPRFGFVPAAEVGISPPDDAWLGPAFQARTLSAWSPAIAGTFTYAEPFSAF